MSNPERWPDKTPPNVNGVVEGDQQQAALDRRDDGGDRDGDEAARRPLEQHDRRDGAPKTVVMPAAATATTSPDRRAFSHRHVPAHLALDHRGAIAGEHYGAPVHDDVVVAEIARPFEILLDDEDRHLALLT